MYACMHVCACMRVCMCVRVCVHVCESARIVNLKLGHLYDAADDAVDDGQTAGQTNLAAHVLVRGPSLALAVSGAVVRVLAATAHTTNTQQAGRVSGHGEGACVQDRAPH